MNWNLIKFHLNATIKFENKKMCDPRKIEIKEKKIKLNSAARKKFRGMNQVCSCVCVSLE